MKKIFSLTFICFLYSISSYGFLRKYIYFTPLDSKELDAQPFDFFCLHAYYNAFGYEPGINVSKTYCYNEDRIVTDTITKVKDYRYRLSFTENDTLTLRNIQVASYFFTHTNLKKMIRKNEFLYVELFITTDSLGI
jgi:hypothetical protein